MAKAGASENVIQRSIDSVFGDRMPPNDTRDAGEEPSKEMDAPVHVSKTNGKIESSSLPPIHDTSVMFADIVT